MNLDDVDKVITGYAESVKDNSAEQKGWPSWINIPSKIGQVASMKIFARMMLEQDAKKKKYFYLCSLSGPYGYRSFETMV